MNSLPDLAKATGLTELVLAEIISYLQALEGIEKATLFGSRAKGTFTPGSDVDIALWGAQVTYEIVAKLRYNLNEETQLPYFFDVVDATHSTNAELLGHITRHTLTLYQR
jgi:predicted nucleotidyltransferase